MSIIQILVIIISPTKPNGYFTVKILNATITLNVPILIAYQNDMFVMEFGIVHTMMMKNPVQIDPVVACSGAHEKESVFQTVTFVMEWFIAGKQKMMNCCAMFQKNISNVLSLISL